MNRQVLYGLHSVRAALDRAPERIIRAWMDTRRRDSALERLRQQLTACGIPLENTDRTHLDQIAGDSHHQGIVLEIIAPKERSESELETLIETARQPLFLVLDQVQDPHNLGACLRTCDAVGVSGVILPKDRTVGLTPTVCKVASGAVETVPLFRVTNLARTLRRLKAADIWIAGADGGADQSIFEMDLSGPLALVIGAEGKGLRRLTRQSCDFLVKLPMKGAVESLNLSVAAGVMLYEALRQREYQR